MELSRPKPTLDELYEWMKVKLVEEASKVGIPEISWYTKKNYRDLLIAHHYPQLTISRKRRREEESDNAQRAKKKRRLVDTSSEWDDVLRWSFDTPQSIKSFREKKFGEKMCSPMLRGKNYTQWQIQLYPKGYKDREQIDYYLYCRWFPAGAAAVEATFLFECPQIDFQKLIGPRVYEKEKGDNWGSVRAFKWEKFQGLDQFEFIVKIKVLKLYNEKMEMIRLEGLQPNPNSFEVEIDSILDRIEKLETQSSRSSSTVEAVNSNVSQWLSQEMELEEYLDLFKEEGFEDLDMSVVANLTDEDLLEMGVDKKGHRMKLLSALEKYKDTTQAQG